jgi:hypothetical protein
VQWLKELHEFELATLYLLYTSLCTGELNAIQKKNASSAVLSTEGRVVGLCWANQNLKDLKERSNRQGLQHDLRDDELMALQAWIAARLA